MTLRRQLLLLHLAFLVFALFATLATVYAVQVQVGAATRRFDRVVGRLRVLQDLQLDVQSLDVHFHEVVQQSKPPDPLLYRDIESVATRLEGLGRLGATSAPGGEPASEAIPRRLEAIATHLRSAAADCLDAVGKNDQPRAESLFKQSVEPLLRDADSELERVSRNHEFAQQSATRELVDYDSSLLLATVSVALVGTGLVLLGVWIVRSRLLKPLETIHQATEAFATGDLAHRVGLSSPDELGALGAAMNRMAGALDASQRKYQNLFQNQRDTVIVCDEHGVVLECHEGDFDLLGLPADSALGTMATETWPQWRFHDLTWDDLFARVIQSNRVVRLSEVTLVLPDQRSVVVDMVAYPAHDAGARRLAVALRDAGERVQLQQAARRTEAMEASVNLARGVAHDFKNLLHCAVRSLTEVRAGLDDPVVAEHADSAITACRQAARLSRRLSRFAAEDRGHPELIDVTEAVETILKSLDQSLFETIKLTTDLAPGLTVLCDRDQLTQIVLNLVYNACEAMPDGGGLCVTGRHQRYAKPAAATTRTDRYVLLTVADTGTGIPPQLRDRVFEPLFSTKPRTEDGPRGLGLAIVYGAASNADGFVTVSSAPGGGTTFYVYLPARDGSAPIAS